MNSVKGLLGRIYCAINDDLESPACEIRNKVGAAANGVNGH